MYKIAVMGGADTVLGFRALGLDTHPVGNADEARRVLHHLTAECQDVAIIYIEETLASALSAEIEKFQNSVRPAIVLIPGREGSTGQGLTALHEAVKRAIGTDIL
jgi:V/A-type H+-transporting ATPase subunit F